ncbi:ChrR family anti-sigma-E factor [Rhizobium halophytocola]|uniref:Transcriptional regulator n=1 Tax=Rhizobium halophytocola TaxID=735519 RepID=A0ABS4DTP9_9HYPH|nr:ChrR family anti-sigma-E factor [Rhizobium halophytocola]MBP1849073.1 putative transcriptional regulator [Rhizobium halophytocola]
MIIQHHLSDETILEYAGGSLSEAWSIAVASHLALCPACRKRLRGMEDAGGALMATIECADTSSDQSWEEMKRRLADAPRVTPEPAASADLEVDTATDGARLPEPLRSYLGGDLDGLKWKSLGGGAYHLPIPTEDRSASARLLRIGPGKAVPEHTHNGRELTLVLKGSYHDGARQYRTGDISEADEDVEHQPIVDMDGECVCLAITDAPLKFRSWVVRLVQPFLGI